MSVTFTDEETVRKPLDTIPPDLDGIEYPCRVCGAEAGPYAGRGQRPKLCPEHKRNGSQKGTQGRTRAVTSNAKLADQAAEALVQINSLMGAGAFALGMRFTASAMAQAQEGFKVQAYEALLTDPKLCQMIVSAGTKSGKVSLLIAYGMMMATVGPVALMEYQKLRADRGQEE